MTDLEIDRYIRSLQDTLTVAKLNYEIWWVYKAADTRPKYVDSMNRYFGFFSVSIHARFMANVVVMYRILERRRDSINLDRLLQALLPEVRRKLPVDFDCRIGRARQLWRKIAVIRNNCFGHINREQEVLDMFSKAALTSDEIRELMDLSESLLNDISLAQSGSVHAFDLDSRHDTIRLLDDLNGLLRRRKALRFSALRRPTA